MFLRAAIGVACSGWAQRLSGQVVPVPTADERVRRLAENAPLTLQFAGSTAPEARAWQRAFRGRLDALLGPYRPPDRWEVVREATVEFPDHTREQRLLTAPGFDPVPVYLLRPRGGKSGARGRRPAIVAIHGHGLGYDSVVGRDDTPELKAELARFRYDYGLGLVRRGYVVAAPCLTPFGRRLSPDPGTQRRDACETTQLRLQMVGRLLITENLRDVLWTMEDLLAHPDVDPNRLGCVGLSLGGRMTMMAAAVEPRIKVAVIAGALNCLQERVITRSIGGCQTIPGLLEYGDTPEISGLIAPRPILWTLGDRDQLIDPVWAQRALKRIGNVYRAMGAADQVQVHRFSGGHEWDGAEAYPLLDRVLAS